MIKEFIIGLLLGLAILYIVTQGNKLKITKTSIDKAHIIVTLQQEH